MARIRSIKPEFFLHEDLTQLSPLHRLLFIGLWTQADKAGRLEDRPRRLKVQLLPFDDCDLNRLLADLDKNGFIQRYVDGDTPYIAIPSFEMHQRTRTDEPESEIPSPPERRRSQRVTAAVTEASLRSDEPVTAQMLGKEGKGEGERNGEGEGRPEFADALLTLWNTLTNAPLPRCRELTSARKDKIRLRRKEHPELAWWREAIQKVAASDFCRGMAPGRHGEKAWVANFDWLIENGRNAVKAIEGNYDNREPQMVGTGKTAGNAAALLAFVERGQAS